MSDLIETSEQVGRAAGGVTGFVAGAQAGTAVIPIPAVGTFLGGVVGALVGVGLGGPLAKGLALGGRAIVRGTNHARTPVVATAGPSRTTK
jgi:phage tail tape-measure protein